MAEKIICPDCGGLLEETGNYEPKVYKCLDCSLEFDEKDLEGDYEG